MAKTCHLVMMLLSVQCESFMWSTRIQSSCLQPTNPFYIVAMLEEDRKSLMPRFPSAFELGKQAEDELNEGKARWPCIFLLPLSSGASCRTFALQTFAPQPILQREKFKTAGIQAGNGLLFQQVLSGPDVPAAAARAIIHNHVEGEVSNSSAFTFAMRGAKYTVKAHLADAAEMRGALMMDTVGFKPDPAVVVLEQGHMLRASVLSALGIIDDDIYDANRDEREERGKEQDACAKYNENGSQNGGGDGGVKERVEFCGLTRGGDAMVVELAPAENDSKAEMRLRRCVRELRSKPPSAVLSLLAPTLSNDSAVRHVQQTKNGKSNSKERLKCIIVTIDVGDGAVGESREGAGSDGSGDSGGTDDTGTAPRAEALVIRIVESSNLDNDYSGGSNGGGGVDSARDTAEEGLSVAPVRWAIDGSFTGAHVHLAPHWAAKWGRFGSISKVVSDDGEDDAKIQDPSECWFNIREREVEYSGVSCEQETERYGSSYFPRVVEYAACVVPGSVGVRARFSAK